jgi:hypothetical protein
VGRRWFGEPADEAALGPTLARLAGEVARLLDRLEPPEAVPVVPGSARVDPAAAAIVLSHRRIPGCSLVVQVAEWSAGVGCWWSTADDPLAGPAAGELFAEFPLRPDGPGRAVAWLERELRRPVTEREHRYGVGRRQVWSVVLDDGRELAVRGRWRPGPAVTGLGGIGPRSGRGLLGVAVGAAGLLWALNLASFRLAGSGWLYPAAWGLHALAFAALLVWFGVAGLDHPARVRVPMLGGLLLATLASVGRLVFRDSAELPSPSDSVPELLWRFAGGWLPALLGTAAVACYLAAFLGLPGRASLRPPWPRALPVAAGLAWSLDLAVGLAWLARVGPIEETGAATTWYSVLLLVLRAVTLGLAVVLVLVVLDRRPAMARRPARAGLAGAALLALGSSVLVQAAVAHLVPLLPQIVGLALFGAVFVVVEFAGTALLAVAAVEAPLTPAPGAGPPAPLRSPAR